MEQEKKKIAIKTVVSKNKRTGKYREREVEVEKTGRNITSSHKDYGWDKGLYDTYHEESEKPKIKTLQEYLNNEYPAKKDKEKVRDIRMDKINERRIGLELLEGGELDLREYKNVD